MSAPVEFSSAAFKMTLPHGLAKSLLQVILTVTVVVTVAWALLPILAATVAVIKFGADPLWFIVGGIGQLLWLWQLGE